MRITWRDGITTLAAGGAVVLERAYFHNWDWPLMSSIRWAIVGIAVMSALVFLFGYLYEGRQHEQPSALVLAIGLVIAGLAALGLIFNMTDYVVLMMIGAVVLWLVVTARHLFEATLTAHHA